MRAPRLVALTLLLWGCSASGDTTDTGPSVGDTGTDVTVPDASSRADAEVDVDSAAPLPLTAENYCESSAAMFCDYYMRCGRMAAASVEECLATFMESCNEVYEPRYQSFEERGLLALSQEGFETCRAHLETVQCHQQLFDLDGGCSQMWAGLASQEDPCAPGIGSFVCETGTVCTLTLDFCGTCTLAAEVGSACPEGVRCETGAQCVEGTCLARALPGENCGDLQPCITGASCVAGVCDGFDVVPVGEACDATRRCQYKAACLGGTCVESALLGQDCAARECASGFCDANVCVPFLAPGDPCTSANQCLSLRCEGGVCGELERTCFE